MLRRLPFLIVLGCMLLNVGLPATTLDKPTFAAPLSAPAEGFAHSGIRARWSSDERGALAGRSTWMWGPGPFYTNYEPHSEAPDGNHLVQYFDKGRLEVNDPGADRRSPWFVTSGLLVSEMVSGQAATGARSAFSLGPANISVAGDTTNAEAPTYASFAKHTARSQDLTGQRVTDRLDKSGAISPLSSSPAEVSFDRYEQATGHNWADVFWRFANDPNRPASFDWLFALGYPITQPYWVTANVKGAPRTVLVQLFQRRTLTFDPSNPAASRVEMGNAGRHYYLWRYADLRPADLQAQYSVTMTIGTAPARTTAVVEKVKFTNATGAPLRSAVFRVVWNNWDGAFALGSVSAGGAPAQTRWRQGINLEVIFPRAVSAGQAAAIDMQFQVRPRPVGGRTGYDRANDILSSGDMLPTLVPWENGGWSYYPYSDLGDFGYYDTADYIVRVETSEPLVVGGTGKISEVNDRRTSYLFTAPRVRDVAYIASPRFVDPLKSAMVSRQAGNTRVLAYFLPQHQAAARQQLDLTVPALDWLSRTIGAYPFDSYTVAQMGVPQLRSDNYAQEYPATYFVPTNWLALGAAPGTWTWYTPVHEVAHQWFYSTIGSNQVTDPWLDEAMTSYVTAEYLRANFPGQYARAFGSMTASATNTRPVSSGVFSGFANENEYSATIYDTGVKMLDRVRLAMGDEAFYEALRAYYDLFRFKRASPANLLEILQSHSRADLKGIFSQYLGY